MNTAQKLLGPILTNVGAWVAKSAEAKGLKVPMTIGTKTIDAFGAAVEGAGILVDVVGPKTGGGRVAVELLSDFTAGYGTHAIVDDPATTSFYSGPAAGGAALVVTS
jgi:hypothetical protein